MEVEVSSPGTFSPEAVKANIHPDYCYLRIQLYARSL
jgi:hypothetical protein